MTTHQFYRQFEDVPKDARFDVIRTQAEPTSLFVIFKQLSDVQAQLRYFHEREAHLLAIAEVGFKQLKNKNG
jgi:hypothetical protein